MVSPQGMMMMLRRNGRTDVMKRRGKKGRGIGAAAATAAVAKQEQEEE
jgi:hypothetical protein